MTQCLNPDCLTLNLETHRFCQRCGKPLWLKDRYQALKLIGQGGFGKTFLAVDQDKPSKPLCVIKQFFPQLSDTASLAKAEELFTEEAKRLDELGHHDQIPSLLAHFSLDDRKYLVQEYIEGENLKQELEKSGIFSQNKIEKLLLDLLPVLDFIHHVPVIHRDIKPENIIRRNSDQRLVLVDFGASKLITTQNRSVTGTIIGSAEYAAPEQVNGKATPVSDLYSLGVTCVHLLTGISPFELFDSEEFEWAWKESLGSNSVTEKFAVYLEKMICPGTKKRYQTAKQCLDLLIDQTQNKSKNQSILKSFNTVQSDFEDSKKLEIFSRVRSIISDQLEISLEKIEINTKIFEESSTEKSTAKENNPNTSKGSIGGFLSSLSSLCASSSVNYGDYGMTIANDWGDEMDAIELIMAIEEEFSVEIPDETAETMSTVEGIVEYLFTQQK